MGPTVSVDSAKSKALAVNRAVPAEMAAEVAKLAQLEKSAHQILEIKILETPKTGLLAPKKLGQDLLVSALTNLPVASPTL